MSDAASSDNWGKGIPQDDTQQSSRPLQTVQSKFLDAVKNYAEQKYVELVVHRETPTTGYGFIQKNDGFSNLYAFHFEFNSASAVFYLGTDEVAIAKPDQRREVSFSSGVDLDGVLKEIRAGIDAASRSVFPELGALSGGQSSSQEEVSPLTSLSSLKGGARPSQTITTARDDAATVWGQDEKGTKAELHEGFRRSSPWPRRGAIVAILVVAFLLTVPILQSSGACPACNPSQVAGTGQTTYYSSMTGRYFGIGGQYFPPSQGWTGHEFIGWGAGPNGTKVSGFAFDNYYFGV